MTEYRASSGLHSGSSGGSAARIAFLNPACSNATFQSSTPCFSGARHSSGVAGSM